jgi:predicted glycoside hydrolase/deacetylase ChbG (UPF0249 family)
MKKLLIINADDFGLSRGLNYGIVDAFRNGVVRSTTAMVTMNAIEHAAELSVANPELAVGLHFVLTLGRPLTNAPSLVGDDGELNKEIWDKAEKNQVVISEVEKELECQYEKFCKVFGRKPSHIDSHHHVHMIEQIFPTVARFANNKELPLRVDPTRISYETLTKNPVTTSSSFCADFYGDEISSDIFLDLIEREKDGISSLEIMCHPAYIDQDLLNSNYSMPRLVELQVLTNPNIAKGIATSGFDLGNFTNLRMNSQQVNFRTRGR